MGDAEARKQQCCFRASRVTGPGGDRVQIRARVRAGGPGGRSGVRPRGG